MVAFGVGFSFKAQSIFILPFLGILFLRKQLRWYDFLIVPVIYLVLAIPTDAGELVKHPFIICRLQAGQFTEPARYAPNLYILMALPLHPGFEIGTTIFFLAMLAWMGELEQNHPSLRLNSQSTALASAALVPFLLPKMLDLISTPPICFHL